jgi:hypothetical protein
VLPDLAIGLKNGPISRLGNGLSGGLGILFIYFLLINHDGHCKGVRLA